MYEDKKYYLLKNNWKKYLCVFPYNFDIYHLRVSMVIYVNCYALFCFTTYYYTIAGFFL